MKLTSKRVRRARRGAGAEAQATPTQPMLDPAPVKVDPGELRFPVAINTASVQKLRVHAAAASATFKIKTTNPKRYSVRPNVGIAWSEAPADVTVQLCAF